MFKSIQEKLITPSTKISRHCLWLHRGRKNGAEIHGLASREITKKFIIYACVHPKSSYKLLTYSSLGELVQISPELPDEWDEFGRLTSHSSGLLALVHNKGMVYI